MILKKVCMIGTSAVGKTSLVAKFVHSIFSDRYLTTVGVKIDKKALVVDDTDLTLVLWDLAGDDDFQRLQTSYLRGSAGFLLVADGTRAVTLDQVLEIHGRARAAVGPRCRACWHSIRLTSRPSGRSMKPASPASPRSWEIIHTSAKAGNRRGGGVFSTRPADACGRMSAKDDG